MNEKFLKFLSRGKREDTEKWVEGYYVELPEDQHGKKLCLIIGLDGQYNRIIPETAGRCTGLTDKNGTEIFEGDILKADYPDGDTCYYEITWREAGFHADCDEQIYISSHYVSDDEVVGNVHDNPELIGGTE